MTIIRRECCVGYLLRDPRFPRKKDPLTEPTRCWKPPGGKPRTTSRPLCRQRRDRQLLRQAAQLRNLGLRESSYQVDLAPPEITLPDGGLFRPDLAIVDDQGATHFVEVERDVDKNLEQRQAKWRNFHPASGGRMFVVCDNRSCMRNIRSEINYCLGNMSLVVSLTNLADLQAGKRGEGDSIWLEMRNRGKY